MERFGQYTLIKKIAQGGMADIYIAQQRGIKRFRKPMVIKKLFPHMAQRLSIAEMFFNEAKIAAWFNHPNIVQIFDLGTIEDTHYLAMEFIDGPSLKGLLEYSRKREVKLPLPVTLFIIGRIASALSHVHSLSDRKGNPIGLVHRDVNPQNIMINSSGCPKLLDFGVAVPASSSSSSAGTVGYMSPEQCRGEKLDHRSDIFSLGVVLYECITSNNPFFEHGDPEQVVIQKTVSSDPSPPSSHNPLCDSELDGIVARCLAKDPDQRFRDASELSEAIFRYTVKHGIVIHENEMMQFLSEVTGKKRRGPVVWPVDLEDEHEELGSFLFDDIDREKENSGVYRGFQMDGLNRAGESGNESVVLDATKRSDFSYKVLLIIESIVLLGMLIYFIVK